MVSDFTLILWELALALNDMDCKSEQVGLAVMLKTCIREVQWQSFVFGTHVEGLQWQPLTEVLNFKKVTIIY